MMRTRWRAFWRELRALHELLMGAPPRPLVVPLEPARIFDTSGEAMAEATRLSYSQQHIYLGYKRADGRWEVRKLA